MKIKNKILATIFGHFIKLNRKSAELTKTPKPKKPSKGRAKKTLG